MRETSSGRALPSLWILVVLVLGGPGAIRAEAQAPAAPLLWKEYIYLGPRVVAVENAGSNVVKGIGIGRRVFPWGLCSSRSSGR